jgi:hypothetical protein
MTSPFDVDISVCSFDKAKGHKRGNDLDPSLFFPLDIPTAYLTSSNGASEATTSTYLSFFRSAYP